MSIEVQAQPALPSFHYPRNISLVEAIESNPSTPSSASKDEDGTKSDYIITSPYTEPHHQLSLSSLPDPQSALLAQALQSIHAATPDYAIVPYTSALTWDDMISHLRDLCARRGHTWQRQTFYIVAFMSRLKQDIDQDLLARLDEESHAEAVERGGLLKYWFGSPDADRRNLATCVWVSEAYAKQGGTGPWHRRARMEAPNLYESIEFKRMDLVIEDGVSGWWIE